MTMKSKDLVAKAKQQNAQALAAAFNSGDEAQMSEAMANFCSDVHDAVLQQAAEEIEQRNTDAHTLATRGVRVLTSAEQAWYQGLGECIKAPDPKQALTNWNQTMPETIIDGVMGTIQKEHPLLDRLNFVNTSYLTRYLMNKQPAQTAVWGPITSKVEKELNGAFEEVNLTLCKLSCFMAISNDLIDLGPQWLDQYVRETLAEAIAQALESAVVCGTGKGEPIGMTRDVSASASVQDGAYPEQTPIKVAAFTPEALGPIVAKLARDPIDPDKSRAIAPDDLILLYNPFDYWNKIMPATSFRRSDGTWVHDVFPIPADGMQTAALAQGRAVLGIPSRYFVGLGVYGKNGVIQQDDSARFLEDERLYKAKLQGNARPMDEYSFVLLDIENMETRPFIYTSEIGSTSSTSAKG